MVILQFSNCNFFGTIFFCLYKKPAMHKIKMRGMSEPWTNIEDILTDRYISGVCVCMCLCVESIHIQGLHFSTFCCEIRIIKMWMWNMCSARNNHCTAFTMILKVHCSSTLNNFCGHIDGPAIQFTCVCECLCICLHVLKTNLWMMILRKKN